MITCFCRQGALILFPCSMLCEFWHSQSQFDAQVLAQEKISRKKSHPRGIHFVHISLNKGATHPQLLHKEICHEHVRLLLSLGSSVAAADQVTDAMDGVRRQEENLKQCATSFVFHYGLAKGEEELDLRGGNTCHFLP